MLKEHAEFSQRKTLTIALHGNHRLAGSALKGVAESACGEGSDCAVGTCHAHQSGRPQGRNAGRRRGGEIFDALGPLIRGRRTF